MKEFLLFIMNFLDFWFIPLFICLVVAFIVERVAKFRDNFSESDIAIAVRVRRFFWNQNLLFNFTWFLLYFVVSFMLRTPASQMPNTVWQG